MPRGRPRGHKPLIDIIGAKRRVALIEKQYEAAMNGDQAAAKMLLDRMDPTLARQELTGKDGASIALEHKDLSHWSTEDLKELDALADQMEQRRTHAGNGNLQ